MRPREIDIHIDRIALSAMPVGGERRLREAVAREVRLMALSPAAPPGALPEGDGADRVGTRIAGHVRQNLPTEAGHGA